MNEFIAFGTERTVTKTIPEGRTIGTSKGILYIKERSLVDVVEVFEKFSWNEGAWQVKTYLIDTIRPVSPEPPRVPEPAPPSTWSRFWAWLLRKQPIPQMKVINNAD